MSIIRRVTTTLSARVGRLVGELENHDAVVEAGIRDARGAYARAQVRHLRLLKDGDQLSQRMAALGGEAETWEQRALSCSEEDKALECLSRRNQAREQAASLARALERHRELEDRLGGELAAIRARIADLEQQRRLLRSREATADAACQLQGIEEHACVDLDEAFERWEIKVTEAELTVGAAGGADPLERSFLVAEERSTLRAELDTLKRDRETRS